MSFFFKVYPEIIQDGRLFIAEPPLYRVDDKKNPFVINKEDYINRYVKAVLKEYKLGYREYGKNGAERDTHYLSQSEWADFLSETSSYVDDVMMLVEHYKINGRLLEMIYEEFALKDFDYDSIDVRTAIKQLNIQHLIDRIGTEFTEIEYDDKSHFIIGVIDARQQLIEIDETLIRKGIKIIKILQRWMAGENSSMILRAVKNATEYKLSLLGILKILKKYQPPIEHRFKGLNHRSY